MNLTPVIQNDDIYQLEETDDVIGGAGGTANQPHQNLLNRQTFLDFQQQVYHQLGDKLFIRSITAEDLSPQITIYLPALFGRNCASIVTCQCAVNKSNGGILADGLTWENLNDGTWLWLFISNSIGISVGADDFLLTNQIAVTGYTRVGIVRIITRLTTDSGTFTADNTLTGPSGSARLYKAHNNEHYLFLEMITGSFNIGNTVSDGVGGSGTITAINKRIREYCQDGRRISWTPYLQSVPICLLYDDTPATTWGSFSQNGWPASDEGLRLSIDIIGSITGAADVALWVGPHTLAGYSIGDNFKLLAAGINEAVGFRSYIMSSNEIMTLSYKSRYNNTPVRIYCTAFTIDPHNM